VLGAGVEHVGQRLHTAQRPGVPAPLVQDELPDLLRRHLGENPPLDTEILERHDLVIERLPVVLVPGRPPPLVDVLPAQALEMRLEHEVGERLAFELVAEVDGGPHEELRRVVHRRVDRLRGEEEHITHRELRGDPAALLEHLDGNDRLPLAGTEVDIQREHAVLLRTPQDGQAAQLVRDLADRHPGCGETVGTLVVRVVLVRRRGRLEVVGEAQAGDLQRVRERGVTQDLAHRLDEGLVVGERVERLEPLHVVVGGEVLLLALPQRRPDAAAGHEVAVASNPAVIGQHRQHLLAERADPVAVEQLREVQVPVLRQARPERGRVAKQVVRCLHREEGPVVVHLPNQVRGAPRAPAHDRQGLARGVSL
jgi:hypothetical protein